MKTIISTVTLLGLLAVQLQAQHPAQLTTDQVEQIRARQFTDAQDCTLASEAYRAIKIGSPLADVIELNDTPLPQGLFWPSHVQKDGSTITIQGTVQPPAEWGTNYIARIDGQSSKQFYFFHDGMRVVRIAYASLQLTSEAPDAPPAEEPVFKPKGPWIMEE